MQNGSWEIKTGHASTGAKRVNLEISQHMIKSKKTVTSMKTRILYTATLVLLVSFSSFSQAADDYYQAGTDKFSQGDFQGAVQYFDQAIRMNPKMSNAYNSRGVAKFYLGQYSKAISDYNKAIEYNSKFALAFYNRANAKLSMSDYKGAIADYTKTLDLNPQNSNAYVGRGRAKYYLFDLDGGCQDFKAAQNAGNAKAAEYVKKFCTK